MALNWRVVPAAALLLSGEIAIDASVSGAVTFRAPLALLPAAVAVIVALPGATAVATPPGMTVATPVAPEVQAAVALMSAVELFEYVAVATKRWVASAAASLSCRR